RRRHTRFSRDWSSDVCSSDLSSRDERVADLPLFEGLRRRRELLERAEPGQVVVLNAWLDASFLARNASRSPSVAGLLPALAGSQIGRASCRERGEAVGGGGGR